MALASGSERFRVPKTSSEETGLVNDTVPPSTKYKNKWAVNTFAEWQSLREVKVPVFDCGGVFKDYELHKVCALSADIAAMDVLSLHYWLSKFVMEVAKKSGERYPPRSVYGIICSLKRHNRPFVCLVAWPLNESEAGVDLVLIETLLLFICKFILISMRTASLTLGHQCMNN